MSDWIDVAPSDAIASGEFEIVDLDDTSVAVLKVDDEFFAVEDVCTHDGAELAGGPIEDHQIVCPRHGARFCLRTGAALAPPAYEPIAVFDVRVNNGTVQIRDTRFD